MQRLPLPLPAPTQTQDVEWTVLRAGEPAPQDVVVLAMPEFDKLVSNQIDALRWIKEAVEQLRYYRGEGVGGDTKR